MSDSSSAPVPGSARHGSRAVIYLLCGLAFSGKSTLARSVNARFGCPVISLDELTEARGLDLAEGVPAQEWAASHRQALARAESLLLAGEPRLVVDDTSCYRFLRDDWRELAARCGAELRLVVLGASEEEVRRRMSLSRGRRDRRDLAPAVFDAHAASFEWPGADEPHLRVPADAEPSAWVAAGLP